VLDRTTSITNASCCLVRRLSAEVFGMIALVFASATGMIW